MSYGKWKVRETPRGIVINGGILDSEEAVFRKAEELLGRPISRAGTVVKSRVAHRMDDGEHVYYDELFYYAIASSANDAEKAMDGFVDDISCADASYYHLEYTTIGYKLSAFVKEALPAIICGLMIAGLNVPMFMNPDYFAAHSDAMAPFVIPAFALTAIAFFACNSVADVMNNRRTCMAQTNTGYVYIADCSNVDNISAAEHVRKALAKKCKKNPALSMREQRIDDIFFFIVNDANTNNTDIPYAADEIIQEYSCRYGKTVKLRKNRSEDNEAVLEKYRDEYKDSDDAKKLIKMVDDIRANEYKALASHTIADNAESEVNDFLNLKNTNKAAYTRLLNQLLNVNNTLESMQKSSVNVDEALKDLNEAMRLKERRQ